MAKSKTKSKTKSKKTASKDQSEMTMHSFRLTETDLERLDRVGARYGVTTRTSALRVALKLASQCSPPYSTPRCFPAAVKKEASA